MRAERDAVNAAVYQIVSRLCRGDDQVLLTDNAKIDYVIQLLAVNAHLPFPFPPFLFHHHQLVLVLVIQYIYNSTSHIKVRLQRLLKSLTPSLLARHS